MTETQSQQETLGFQAEVKQLLHLVTHALYSNKEIFLRELISNASDALDRLRFASLSDAALYENDSELKVWIDFNVKDRTITIRDNGIGMNREEVITNLGTIAKSGTREFLQALQDNKSKDTTNLIGQFGVGFYSSFVVSDKVTVKSRRAGTLANQGVLWESAGEGEYTITNIDRPERGTEVILYLKKDEDEFLDPWRLRSIITKYSDHILFPIMMPKIDLDEKKDKATVINPEQEMVNRATALWTLPKKDIKEDEYNDLYKHISHDFAAPLLYSHNHVEGKLDYISLLYIPEHAPFDLWQREHRHGLKLYAQRVFIMDDAEHLLPNYLRFVRGIVDSRDLPLNVSREILQSNKVIESIRSGLVKRVLDMLEKLAQDDATKYAKFWQTFGQVMKEAPAEDYANRERIAKLLRFASTNKNSTEQNVALDDYISRMQSGQEKIYYLTADSFIAAQNSPHLEIFRKKGIEVLLLSERIDEWLVAHLTEYNGKQLQSVAKGDLDLSKLEQKENPEQKEQQEQAKQACATIVEKIKKVLGEKIKEVRVSDRLTDSPACLIANDTDMSFHLQRIMLAAGQPVPTSKPILEINPEHPLIKRLQNMADETKFGEWTEIIFAQSLLAEGGQLENPAEFVKRLNKVLLEK